MENKKTIFWIVIVLLLITNLITGYYCYQFSQDLNNRDDIILEYEQGTRTSGDSGTDSETPVNLNKYHCDKDEALYSTGKQFKYMVCYPMSWWPIQVLSNPVDGQVSWIGITNSAEDSQFLIQLIDTNVVSFSTKKAELAVNSPGSTYLGEETKDINGVSFTQLNFKNNANNEEYAKLMSEKNSLIYLLSGYSQDPNSSVEDIANEIIESFEFLSF
ncbi:hypothetical protein ACFL14_02260 [Patescibacteria group bacterium]